MGNALGSCADGLVLWVLHAMMIAATQAAPAKHLELSAHSCAPIVDAVQAGGRASGRD